MLIQCGIPSTHAEGFSDTVPLSSLDGTNGFELEGATSEDYAGQSVSTAGDINGDGIDDLIVGAPCANSDSDQNAGRSYVLFGRNDGFPATLALPDLDGTNGFTLVGEATDNFSGWSVSGAGDINGDGFDEVIVGASRASPNGDAYAGRSYVVFGRDEPFPAVLLLADLDGAIGFKLDGEASEDYSGQTVSGAGDINGDGLDDLIVGAPYADPSGPSSGRSYVVFGREGEFPATLSLASLDGTTGFKLDGETAGDFSGGSVSGLGDINGDGLDDLILGASGADPNGLSSGRSYVVFGREGEFPATLSLASLDGTTGFKLDGEAIGDFSGGSVSAAGDVNADGFNDLIIGAHHADPGGLSSGRGYVVFGRNVDFPGTLSLAQLDGSTGFKLDGAAAGDFSGASGKAARDINGDGIDDLIVGASGADPNEKSLAGRSYVVFGRNAAFPPTVTLADLGGAAGFKLDGESSGDRSGLSVSAAGDVNGDGVDDLIVGAPNADPNGYNSGRSYIVFGHSTILFRDGFEE